jgi:hypothetical protein
MSLSLADRLRMGRRRQFVGRAAELALFQAAISAAELPFYVLHVFGPGGVGKTMLLVEYASICAQAEIPAYYVDGRDIDPTPGAFIAALRNAMGLEANVSPVDTFVAHERRQALLIDTYDAIDGLDRWLRDVFLPQLPEHMLIVLASRRPPTLPWRTDPGWRALVRTLPMRNLTPEESRAYLASSVVPQSQHQTVLQFTHGHPLALSLIADLFARHGTVVFQPEAAPDVVKTLLEQFVEQAPSPAHRAALDICGLVRLTSEPLLSDLLGVSDVHELFDWLRDLSFIEAGREGLYPQDPVREALMADLRWRDPDWHADLRGRLRVYYAKRLQQAPPREQQRILIDYIYLHRANPVVRPFFESGEGVNAVADTPRPTDWPELRAMVARHEGEGSAQLATHWFERQPEGVIVFRSADSSGQASAAPLGFLAMVALERASEEDISADPGIQAAWTFLQQTTPLRPGERATIFRFWMERDRYQMISQVQKLIGVATVRHYLTTPGLAFTFFPCADPDFWRALYAYADLQRLLPADFIIHGRRYGVYGHDWRIVPPLVWLEVLAERELSQDIPAAAPQAAATLLVLSEPDFRDAVRDALRGIAALDALRGSPLLRSRLVFERAGPHADATQQAAALQTLLRDASESLRLSPRDAKAYRALSYTYLHPQLTQEQASEALGLPFSTFRRHLRTAVERVCEQLWQWEIHGVEQVSG